MNNLKTTTFLVIFFHCINVFSQKIIICGQLRKSHISNIEIILGQLKATGAKYKVFISQPNALKPQKIDLKLSLANQLPIDASANITTDGLISKLSTIANLTCRDYPKKKVIMVCINKFSENILLPHNCERIELSEFLENSILYKKSLVILALTPNFIELKLEKPDNYELEESIINIKGNIKSNAEISSIRFQFRNKGWQTIDRDQLTFKNGMVSFWLQDQWPYTGNIEGYITIEVIDEEGNKIFPEYGPFIKTDKKLNSTNCFFKYYQKNLHDVALVKYYKNSNVYWFPIYSEIDPSNLSFVLVNKLGQRHISIKLIEDINFVKNSINEYCIGIACGDLNIGETNCDCEFDGSCVLMHNENNSKSLPIEIHLKNWKPSFIAPLAECSK